MTHKICLKISNLRKLGYFSLREWMEEPGNVYVGRRGRLWITEEDKTKTLFMYPDSKWKNPYKVGGEMSLERSLQLYREYLTSTGLINEVQELKGLNLGCFCKDGEKCHAQLLVDLIEA
uniref:DUF4326 domain-containing protein n=1 Tax=viral metagenome TaxID=1070528 RepID=A0A6C0EJW9_9ZZZZ